MKRKTPGLKTQGSIKIFLILLNRYYFSTLFGSFLLWNRSRVEDVGIDGRVPIICPKAVPLGYEYVVVTLYLFNNGDQKTTTNPSGWNLIADELKDEYSSTTFDSSLGYQDIETIPYQFPITFFR